MQRLNEIAAAALTSGQMISAALLSEAAVVSAGLPQEGFLAADIAALYIACRDGRVTLTEAGTMAAIIAVQATFLG